MKNELIISLIKLFEWDNDIEKWTISEQCYKILFDTIKTTIEGQQMKHIDIIKQILDEQVGKNKIEYVVTTKFQNYDEIYIEKEEISFVFTKEGKLREVFCHTH